MNFFKKVFNTAFFVTLISTIPVGLTCGMQAPATQPLEVIQDSLPVLQGSAQEEIQLHIESGLSHEAASLQSLVKACMGGAWSCFQVCNALKYFPLAWEHLRNLHPIYTLLPGCGEVCDNELAAFLGYAVLTLWCASSVKTWAPWTIKSLCKAIDHLKAAGTA